MSKPEAVARRWIIQPGMLARKNGTVHPSFPPAVVSRVFFGFTPDWLKFRRKPTPEYPEGVFTNPDGTPMEFARDQAGYRLFSLLDIERMAWSLHDKDLLSLDRLECVLTIVRAVAQLYGYKLEES